MAKLGFLELRLSQNKVRLGITNVEASSFSDVYINRDSLFHELPQIMRCIRDLRMEFVFAEQQNYNLHIVR